MPRTIAAEALGPYEFVPAVWWMIARLTDLAKRGGARLIASFARHPDRGTILGEPAIETRRTGVCETGLQTYQARSRRTSPTSLNAIRSEAPAQYGLPR